MTEYICKCGRKLQRSTQSETTGNKLDGYAPGHECFGCPYVVPITRWENGHFVPDHYECVASKELRYETYASLFSFDRDSTAGHILSLDFDFLRRVAAECDKHEATISLNRDKGGQMFHYKSKYRPDGRFDFTIYPTQNKAGANAKRAIFEKFFTDGGARKDLTPEQEKEKILNDIQEGRRSELPQPYIPGDVYINPADHSRMRVVDVTPDKKERTWQVQRDDGNGWEPANSSVYPHFEDAVRTLAAFVRSYNLVPEYEEEPTCPEPVETALPPVSAPACPAECGTAEPALTAPSPASLAAASTTDMAGQPYFDYSVLSQKTIDTMRLAEEEIRDAKRVYISRVSNAVAMVHHELVSNWDELQNNQHSETTFINWCRSVGISKAAAYRFLQVDRLLSSARPDELATLETAKPSLLYAAAKPSADPDMVQDLKDGKISTLKEWNQREAELKAQLKAKSDELAAEKSRADGLSAEIGAREDKIAELLNASEQADRRAEQAKSREEEARAAADHYHEKYEEANAARNAAIDVQGEYIRRAVDAERKAARFEQIKDAALDEVKQTQAQLQAERSDSRRAAAELQHRIRELEARPVEVVAADPDEVARMAEEKAQAIAAQRSAERTRDRDALQERIEELEELLDDAAQDQIANTQALAVQAVEACDSLMESLFGKILFLPDKEYIPAKRIVESFYAKLGWVLDNNDWPDKDDWALNHSGDESDDESDEEEAEEDE